MQTPGGQANLDVGNSGFPVASYPRLFGCLVRVKLDTVFPAIYIYVSN